MIAHALILYTILLTLSSSNHCQNIICWCFWLVVSCWCCCCSSCHFWLCRRCFYFCFYNRCFYLPIKILIALNLLLDFEGNYELSNIESWSNHLIKNQEIHYLPEPLDANSYAILPWFGSILTLLTHLLFALNGGSLHTLDTNQLDHPRYGRKHLFLC